MAIDSSITMLILKLLEEKDMYGYKIIEELEKKSNNIFSLKAGTLYPILHSLEQKGILTVYDETAENGKQRKYYSITKKGQKLLETKKDEWKSYSSAINNILGGVNYCI